MSSRPSDTNDADMKTDKRELDTQSEGQPSTPLPGSGGAVMETPMTNRHQSSLEPSKSYSSLFGGAAIEEKEDSQNWSQDALKQNAASTLPGEIPPPQSALPESIIDPPSAGLIEPHIVKDTNAVSVIDLKSRPALVEENLDLVPEENASSQTTESSSQEQPHSDGSNKSNSQPAVVADERLLPKANCSARQSPHKRTASSDLNNAYLADEIRTVTSPSAVPSADDTNSRDPPRKRQRRLSTQATEESQNSVRSTIHVELPTTIPPSTSAVKSRMKPPEDIRPSQESSRSNISTPQNHTKGTEPPSSAISNRSTRQGASQDRTKRVLYANSTKVDESTAYVKFLRQHNVKQVKSINDCDVLCTGKGELKRTSKLMLAVLMGKEVVADQWIIQSAHENKLLDTSEFVPEDAKREREWGTSLSDAIERGRRGVKPLEGWTINFTPSAKKELGKSWSELKEICLVAGATAVQAMIPRKSPGESDTTIVIAASNEADRSTLDERGWLIFTKDIITFSVLRGGLDADSDEFLMAKKVLGSAKKVKRAR
ncbi:MAG: hypothetical protein Q9166_003731 [cf. Caloplaca sp. 2 TL-2023]